MTESRRAVLKRYNSSPKGVATKKKYEASPKGKAAHKRYEDSPKGWAKTRKYHFGKQGPAHFEAQLQEQKNLCAICGVELTMGKLGRHCDHNHETEQLRGVLCGFCNLGLGNFKEAPEKLRAAADYLEKWGAKCAMP